MQTNNFRGDLPNISAKKIPLVCTSDLQSSEAETKVGLTFEP